MPDHIVETGARAVPLHAITKNAQESWLSGQDAHTRAWLRAAAFTAEAGAVCLVPDSNGEVAAVVAGLGAGDDPWVFAQIAARLPAGRYQLAGTLGDMAPGAVALAWELASYRFRRYKSAGASEAEADAKIWPDLVRPDGVDPAAVGRKARAVALVRDLINTPASDMGPAELVDAAEAVATRFDAGLRVIVGEGLLAENYPAIYAVGQGAAPNRQPRLIDMVWGDPKAPRLTLVGKGVCFDTGGLDLKPSSNMKLMKKDMGGAAHVLGLASMVMDAALPVRLRVLIPAVENSVSGAAMRPLDVLKTRKGMTVEVGNTDAEGRLILADALWEAAREQPALLVDFATLTGAARVALGPDVPVLFTPDDDLARDLSLAGDNHGEPVWRLPLYRPYRRMLDSTVADIANISSSPYGGAITAALFLAEFVPAGIPWAHFDILAWNASARPGRPEGGEAMALGAVFEVITRRFITL